MTGNPRISEEEAAKLIAMRIESTKTRNYGYYRVGALRSFGGGRKVVPRIEPKLQSVSTYLTILVDHVGKQGPLKFLNLGGSEQNFE